MSQTTTATADDFSFDIDVNGRRVTVDLLSVVQDEWLLVARTLGVTGEAVFEQLGAMDHDTVAALIWIVLRRDDGLLTYEEVESALAPLVED